jgi:phosphoacetylglucosamine mutase
MITASHNPECDNGIKLVDDDGGMMSQGWESYAEDLVNARSIDESIAIIQHICSTNSIDWAAGSAVVIGRDTRPHSLELANCVKLGAEAAQARIYDLGEVSTPQLHFIVQHANGQDVEDIDVDPECSIANYHRTLSGGYLNLRDTAGGPSSASSVAHKLNHIVIDGSNGIGAAAVAEIAAVINMQSPGALNVDIRNTVGSGPVNEGCGAELVQKNQQAPAGVDAKTDRGKIMCSFDGDADRIVFHSYLEPEGKWTLLDGDKIAALVSLLLAQELRAAGLADSFTMGVVQTAYANGASTIFLRKHSIPIAVAKTGVKYLHHKAQEFDMGVYFEANGHGTVLMSQRLLQAITSWSEECHTETSERTKLAMKRLQV